MCLVVIVVIIVVAITAGVGCNGCATGMETVVHDNWLQEKVAVLGMFGVAASLAAV